MWVSLVHYIYRNNYNYHKIVVFWDKISEDVFEVVEIDDSIEVVLDKIER